MVYLLTGVWVGWSFFGRWGFGCFLLMGLWLFLAVCSALWFLVVIWWCLVVLGCLADDVGLVLGDGAY